MTPKPTQGFHPKPVAWALFSVFWLTMVLSQPLVRAAEGPPKAPRVNDVLVVMSPTGQSVTLAPTELDKLPHCAVRTEIPHTNETASYEGTLLSSVLGEVGVRTPDSSREGKMTLRAMQVTYVLVEAVDGYQVVFSVPEALSQDSDRKILLARRINGQPLPAKAAPYQLVVTGDKGHERWVRQVRRILVRPASASPFPPARKTSVKPVVPMETSGHVYLVGTGPGDPDLITVKAAQILRQADLVLCYSWMKDELAPFVRPGVVEVAPSSLRGGRYLGQKPEELTGDERARAESSNQALAKLKARIKRLMAEGKTVVFADNGDPMIFSPWGWVPQHLAEFDPVVIPGLSSFNAGNAALKRMVAGLGFVTISSGLELGTPDEHGRLAGTIVFFTHRRKLPELLPKLKDRYPADTPLAIVCEVSYPGQRVIRGTIGTILNVLGKEKLPHLYLLYVGDGIKQGGCCK